jgi:hypothetical protein
LCFLIEVEASFGPTINAPAASRQGQQKKMGAIEDLWQ